MAEETVCTGSDGATLQVGEMEAGLELEQESLARLAYSGDAEFATWRKENHRHQEMLDFICKEFPLYTPTGGQAWIELLVPMIEDRFLADRRLASAYARHIVRGLQAMELQEDAPERIVELMRVTLWRRIEALHAVAKEVVEERERVAKIRAQSKIGLQ